MPGLGLARGVVILEEQEQRRRDAAPGEIVRAAMTGHATPGKKLLRGFAFIDVLGESRARQETPAKHQTRAEQQTKRREHEQATAEFGLG